MKEQPKTQRYEKSDLYEGERLKRVTKSDRMKMQLSMRLNRFWRNREDLRSESRIGPGRCKHCGGEPCGASWGPMKGEQSALCCGKCSHGQGVPKWKPTHIIWHGKKAFFVREVPIGRAGSVYLRQDGVAWFYRLGEHHYFLGVRLERVDYARFKVSDRHGWPKGVQEADMGIELNDEALVNGADFEDDAEVRDTSEEGEEDDSEDEGEDDADDEEDDGDGDGDGDDDEADDDDADDDDDDADETGGGEDDDVAAED